MKEKWNAIVKLLKKPENYIPRNYQTIGGMWTVDTYALNGYKFRLEDEGYTQVLLNDSGSFMAILNFKNEISILRGTEQDFETMANHFLTL